MERKRITYFDHLRVTATLAVILIHVAAQNWYAQDVSTFEWQTFNFYDSISRWAVPIFVMISGALMLEKEMSIRTLYMKKIPRLLIAFSFWSTIYAIIEGGGTEKILINIINGKYHLWFIYLIIGLYICIPIIKKIAEDKRISEYYLAVSLVFTFLIPFVLMLIADLCGNAAEVWVKSIEAVCDDMNISLANGYVTYYILGFYLNNIEISKVKRNVIYFLGVLGTVATIILCSFFSVEKGNAVTNYYEYVNINILAQSVAVFVFFKYDAPAMKRQGLLMGKLAKYSFGIYVVHILILEGLQKRIGLNTLSFNPILSVPIISVIVLLISCTISALINRIPILKDYIT